MIDTCGIYAIRNVITGAVYVGASRSLGRRWRGHLLTLNRGKHQNKRLQNDWTMYGESAFESVVLEARSEDDILAISEQKWIDRFRSEGVFCYNIQKATERPPTTSKVVRDRVRPITSVFTVDEIAKKFHMQQRTVINHLQRGALKGFRVGRAWRITREALQQYMEGKNGCTTQDTQA